MKQIAHRAATILPAIALTLALGASCTLVPGASPTPTATATAIATSAAAVAQGKQLYDANCAACHGPDGEGGITVGSSTSANLRAPDLDQVYKSDDALIRRAILDGQDQDGEALDPAMPRWRGKLTDTQVNDIIAYLKTLR